MLDIYFIWPTFFPGKVKPFWVYWTEQIWEQVIVREMRNLKLVRTQCLFRNNK